MKTLFCIAIFLTISVCIGSICELLESNEDFKKIKAKICDPQVRPDSNQFNELMKCRPNFEMPEIDDKWKAKLENCHNISDDVSNLRPGDNGIQDHTIDFMCSEKFDKCRKELKEEWTKEHDGKEFEMDSNKMEEMNTKFENTLSCGKKALNIE